MWRPYKPEPVVSRIPMSSRPSKRQPDISMHGMARVHCDKLGLTLYGRDRSALLSEIERLRKRSIEAEVFSKPTPLKGFDDYAD